MMTIYHVNFKSYGRSKGHSSVVLASHRSGLDLYDTKEKKIQKFKGPGQVVSQQMFAPQDAPHWSLDIHSFWDINEAHETRKNATVARGVVIALPHILNSVQRHHLANDLGLFMVNRYDVAALVALHAPRPGGDPRNHHVHLLLSARKVDASGLCERACTAWDGRQGKGSNEIKMVRGEIASIINVHLARAGFDVRVDHRTLREQALEKASLGLHEEARLLSRDPIRRLSKRL